MFKKGYQIVDVILVIISIYFLYKLYNYKEYLSDKILVKEYGWLKEAFLIVQEPDYFYYLIGGLVVLIMLIGFIYYCINYEQDPGIELVVVVGLNIILTIIVLFVFWSPILTTLCIIGIIGLLAIKGIN
jgi:hypothetical protein